MSEINTVRKLHKKRIGEAYRRKATISKKWNIKNTDILVKDVAKQLGLTSRATSALRTASKTLSKGARGDLIRNMVNVKYGAELGKLTQSNKLLMNWAKLSAPGVGKPKTIASLRSELITSLKEYSPIGSTYNSIYHEKLSKNIVGTMKKNKGAPLTERQIAEARRKAYLQTKSTMQKKMLKQRVYDTHLQDLYATLFDQSPKGEEEELNIQAEAEAKEKDKMEDIYLKLSLVD